MSVHSVLSPSRSSRSTSARLIGAYAALPAISGRSFLPISFFGRLPVTMAPLAILTYTAAGTGSYAAAGLAATATALGTAVGAPLMGRLADRHGQRPVLSVAVVLNALTLTGLALLPEAGGASGRITMLALCALTGLTLPQVGGMARARWLALTRRHTGTAMAYEGTADEIAFVLGPACAGLIASIAGARAALLVAAVGGLLASGAFARHHTHRVTAGSARWAAAHPAGTDPTPAHAGADRGTGATAVPDRLLPLIGVPMLAMGLMGMFFSATQSALTVLAAASGRAGAGGLIYALMAVGSAVTALGSAALPDRIGPRVRCTLTATGLLAGVGLMAASTASVPLLCAAVVFTGLSVGPMLVTLNQVAGAAAPPRRIATAMACLSAGTVTGVAVGASAAGLLAEAFGSGGALAVAAAASALLVLVSLVGLPARTPRPDGCCLGGSKRVDPGA